MFIVGRIVQQIGIYEGARLQFQAIHSGNE